MCKRLKFWMPFCLFFILWSGASAFEKEIKIGIYRSIGSKAIKSTLSKVDGFKAVEIEDLGRENLFQFDVIILGSAKGLPYRNWEDSLELYVRCGGGLLLHHDATGFRGWDEPLFPELFRGKDRIDSRDVCITNKTHEITKSLPSEFAHSYYDHIALELGDKGEVLAKDKNGAPVVVVGKVGNGRVVGNGMVTGFADVKGEGEINKEPEGGEKDLLIRSVKWLAEPGLTSLLQEEFLSRKKKIGSEIALRRGSEVTDSASISTSSGSFGKEWYSDTMVNEQGYIHPPPSILEGRFFLFDGDIVGISHRGRITGREYEEVVSILQQLKWSGVTDIIAGSGGPLRINYLSKVPETTFNLWARRRGFDYLETMVKACHEVGLDVWCLWHTRENKHSAKMSERKPYYIRDAEGNVYAPYLDLLSPQVKEMCRKMIDELDERYNKYGNLKGIFLDEFWHPFLKDCLEDDVDKYIDYCKKNYKEAPPEDIARFFAMGMEWHKPEDKWWRRYVLWKNTIIIDFVGELTEYANSKRLLIMNQPFYTAARSTGWFWGYGDSYRLAREGNLLWTYEARNSRVFEQYPHDKTIFSTYSHYNSGYANVCLVRGNLGSCFYFGLFWLPIGWSVNPNAVDVFTRQVRANREWYGAKSLCEVAVLTNGIGLQLAFRDADRVFARNEKTIQNELSSVQDTGMLMVRNTEYYDRYKVLIAPKYSLNFIPEETYKELMKYIEGGGNLVLLGGEVMTSREEHTDVENRTLKLTGIRKKEDYVTFDTVSLGEELGAESFSFPSCRVVKLDIVKKGVKILAAAKDKDTAFPVVTETELGNGKIVSVHFDVASLLNRKDTKNNALKFLGKVLEELYKPPIYVEGNLKIFSTLKKGNWVVITLLGEEQKGIWDRKYPAEGKLYVDIKKLGINLKKYKVLSLARDRELMPQGKFWSIWGDNYWTSKLIAQGIDIYIAPNSLAELEIPQKRKDSHVKPPINWWRKYKNCRSYEHEIIAIAPVGEAYPGEKE